MKDPSTFVKITAGLFLAFSILCLLVDSIGLLMFHFLLQKTFAAMNYSSSMGPVSAWRMDHMDVYYGLHISVTLMAFVGSLGILYKKPWGPTAFFYFLSIILVFHFSNLGITVATLLTLPEDGSLSGTALPRGMMLLSTGVGVVWIMALIVLYSWLWLSFRKEEVRTVFG